MSTIVETNDQMALKGLGWLKLHFHVDYSRPSAQHFFFLFFFRDFVGGLWNPTQVVCFFTISRFFLFYSFCCMYHCS